MSITRTLLDHAIGRVRHMETHLERGNYDVLRETLPELRDLLVQIDRHLDPDERRRLRVLPGRPGR